MNIWPLQKDCLTFYGNPGNTQKSWDAWDKKFIVAIPCPWKTTYDGKKRLNIIRVHSKCAESLTIVLDDIWKRVGKDQSAIETLHYQEFGGSAEHRIMRGGSSYSMHHFGCAVDWAPAENIYHATKHLFQASSIIVSAFKKQNWIWGGDWSPSSIDAMHFQAARVHP